MVKRITGFVAAAGIASLLAACGGSKGPSDHLLTLRSGATWVYNLTGTVTLAAAQGGGTQDLQANSRLTMQIAAGTSRDLNNQEVGILDRKLDMFLLDGREIKGNFRLYFSQSALGIFVHGVNNYVGDTFNATNDVFVPATTNPAFKFLYLPDPLTDNLALSYTNPLGLTATGDISYNLQIGNKRQSVKTPAGEFFAKGVSITESFNRSLAITNAGFVPETGLVSGVVNATLPDGTKIAAVITLRSLN